jgi:hypothetical protein
MNWATTPARNGNDRGPAGRWELNSVKMDQDGVLEAYILMAIPERGIALDHSAYLTQNRDKLHKYVLNYVIQK